MKKPGNIDEYISAFDPDVQKLLWQMLEIIKKAAPKAEEVISYGMPALKQNRVLVYFAAAKNHIGFYPTAKPMVVFAKELAGYKTSKGAVQFPMDKKLPASLITKMVKYRLKEDREAAVK